MRWWRDPEEQLVTPDDVEAAFRWMFDIRLDLFAIRTLLEERYGEEEDDETDA